MLGFYVKGLIAAVLAGALAGLVSALADKHVQAVWVVAVVLIAFALGLARGMVRRARTTYTITDRRLTIQRGLLARELHEATLERVQNVASRQSLVERLLGVGTVDFDTAGSAEFDFSFAGVEHPRHVVRMVEQALHERGRAARLPLPY
jgi:uncharacterized membrane protein YdbT with pleckstrin-like domain